MSAYERLDRSADKDRDDNKNNGEPRQLDGSVALYRHSDSVAIVYELIDLPVTSTLAGHRFGVEHYRLTIINLHGAPRLLR